jgi:hypothetical protein
LSANPDVIDSDGGLTGSPVVSNWRSSEKVRGRGHIDVYLSQFQEPHDGLVVLAVMASFRVRRRRISRRRSPMSTCGLVQDEFLRLLPSRRPVRAVFNRVE